MSASVIITKNKNAAFSAELLPSGNYELTVESKNFFNDNKVESTNAIVDREELTQIRDTINRMLGE